MIRTMAELDLHVPIKRKPNEVADAISSVRKTHVNA